MNTKRNFARVEQVREIEQDIQKIANITMGIAVGIYLVSGLVVLIKIITL